MDSATNVILLRALVLFFVSILILQIFLCGLDNIFAMQCNAAVSARVKGCRRRLLNTTYLQSIL